MFGMLDYRAHKLYWLLMLPISLLSHVTVLATVAIVALSVANDVRDHYPWIVKLVMAYIPAEIAANVVGFVWLIVCAIVQRVFFW